jgi:branched-chain amino acid transport system ATP-binding protein
MEKILSVDNLSSGYGQFTVLRDINLYVGKGEIVSVVGANGAGKSTLLLTISGHLATNAGQIKFEDQSISNLPAHDCPEKGLV